MSNNPEQIKDSPPAPQAKYPLWFWGLVVVLIILFIIVMLTDPYYKQVPLWGIE